jgi:hypothetical protein
MASLHMSAPASHITHNEVPLSYDLLITILDDLSARILKAFSRPIKLLVHGGAVMILHPTLSNSTTRRITRDVDFIKRSFVSDMRKCGVFDAEAKLYSCIDATAARYRLGSDWFNAHADVALPMAQKCVFTHRFYAARLPRFFPNVEFLPYATSAHGQPYDPIYWDSLKPNNVALNTIYTSPGLTLISVTMFWGVALKMVRYQKGASTKIIQWAYSILMHARCINR